MTPFEKSEAAKHLLTNPVLKEALENIREGLVRQLEAAPMGDVDTHHQAALSLQLLKQVRSELHRFISEQTVIEQRTKHESFLQRTIAEARKLYA